MALELLKPTIWSEQLLRRLNDILVFRQVCTTEFEREISGYGDVIKINEIGTITVNDYTASSTSALTIQTLKDAQKMLKIDRAKYTAFKISRQDYAAITPKVLNTAKEQAAWSLANEVDEYVASLYGEAGVAIDGDATTGVNVSSTNVLKYVALTAQKHDEVNTPNVGRWMVVPPWFAHKLTMSKIVLDTNNSGVLATGKLGSYYGIDIYVSNNVPHLSGTDRACIMSGYKGSIALATQVLYTGQADSIELGFNTIVKTLTVYGARVLRPNNLGILYADYQAEAS
jgi:hypothetical protein